MKESGTKRFDLDVNPNNVSIAIPLRKYTSLSAGG